MQRLLGARVFDAASSPSSGLRARCIRVAGALALLLLLAGSAEAQADRTRPRSAGRGRRAGGRRARGRRARGRRDGDAGRRRGDGRCAAAARGAIETDVPASITQFDASTIQALGAQDISDLSRVTPNVNIVQPGATQATFFVRGIGLSDFSANAAGAVTIFQDDIAFNAPAIQTGQLFDIRDVEIMRGPQGTGPFRNASGGAIRVSSNLPSGNYGA